MAFGLPPASGAEWTCLMPKSEILVIERAATVAHPSYATGGFIVLSAGATAYRNADLVPWDPQEILAWCRHKGCEVTALPDQEPSYRRHRVRFPDEGISGDFERLFGRKPR
jgi:hypothetical protein